MKRCCFGFFVAGLWLMSFTPCRAAGPLIQMEAVVVTGTRILGRN